MSPAPAWLKLLLLMTLFALAGIDRALVSVLAEPIKHEFHLSDATLGALIGLAFSVPYTIAGLPIGMLVDRVNRIRLSFLMVVGWTCATLGAGLLHTAAALVGCRVVLGLAEAGVPPTFTALTADLFSKPKRSTALGWLYAATPIGLTIGFGLGGVIASRYGWRAAFLAAASPGLLFGGLLLLMRDPPRGGSEALPQPAAGEGSLNSLRRVFLQRPRLPLLIAAGCSGIAAQAAISAFLAPFMIRVHGLPLGRAGVLIALAYGLGGTVGLPLGGVLGDWMRRRFPGRELLLASAVTLLSAATAVMAFQARTLSASLAWLSAYSILCVGYWGVLFSAYVDDLPPGLRGGGSAVLLVLQNLVGAGLGPALIGRLSDALSAAQVQAPLRASMLIMTSLYVLAAVLFWISARAGSNGRGMEEAAVSAAMR